MALNQFTVVILTRNESDMIEDCLRSVAEFPHILIVDTGSTDDTLVKAALFPVTIFKYPFTTFRDVRLAGLAHVTTPWVFFLDADERPSPALILQLQTITEDPELGGISVPRRNIVVGGWVAHSGWYPDYQFRIAKVSTVSFESQSVHERMLTSGNVITIPPDGEAYLTHYTCRDLASYVAKINHYTSLEAADRASDPAFKTTGWAIVSRSFGMFTQTLFHFKGRKDGERGVIVATLNMVYSLVLMIKIWEIRKKSSDGQA
jgi:(heptosyl)LPS beta-1,4-glucosyltransferase